MAVQWECPVCGAVNPDDCCLICQECQAETDSESITILKKSGSREELEPKKTEKESAQGLEEEVCEDEVLDLFKKQFEEHSIESPPSWKSRLCFLAGNAEPSQRFAAIIFVDLCQYTSLSNELSPDDMKELLEWYYGMITRVVEFYGGFIISLIGDAVLAAFGAPASFERDAESAIKALLAMRDAVREKGGFKGKSIEISSGADCGSVQLVINEVRGEKRLDLIGPAVNLASRLEAAAQPMEIILSDRLAHQVHDFFEMKPREPFEPKNFGRTVYPYLVIKPLPQKALSRRNHRFRLIGRETELKTINQCWKSVLQGKTENLCISGEVGIGKSRLLKEFFDNLGNIDSFQAIHDCQPGDRHSLLEMARQLLLQITGGIEYASEKGLLHNLPSVIRAPLGYILHEPEYLEALRGIPGKELKQQILCAFTGFFKKITQLKPVLLCVDDIQWTDVFSWELVEQLAKEKISGLFLLITGRSFSISEKKEETHFRASLADLKLSKKDWSMLLLDTLPEESLKIILKEIFAESKLHPAVISRLLEKSSGTPLYLVEMALQLISRKQEGQLSDLIREYDGEDFGSIIQEVLQNQLDVLTMEKRNLLQVSSVLGKRFTYQILRQFEVLQMDLLSELYALKGMHYLRDQRLPDDIAFYFHPSLLRDAAYRMLTDSQKKDLHSLAAQKLENYQKQNPGRFLYEIAYHWLKAGVFSRSRVYLKKAAEKSIDLGLPGEALELTRFALNILEHSSENKSDNELKIALQQECLLHNLAGTATHLLGDYNSSDGHFFRMQEIAREIGNKKWIALSYKGNAMNSREKGELSKAMKYLEKSRALFAEDDFPEYFINTQGVIFLRMGELEHARQSFQKILQQSEQNTVHPLTLADACNNLGLIAWQEEKWSEASTSFQKGLKIWRQEGQMYGQAATLSNLGIIAEKTGDFEDALQYYKKSAALSEKIGFAMGLTAVYANLSNLYLLMDDPILAEQEASRAVDYAEVIRHPYSESVARENLGLSYWANGITEQALEQLHKALSIAESIDNRERIDSSALSLSWVLLHTGDTSSSRKIIEKKVKAGQPDSRFWKEVLLAVLKAKRQNSSQPLHPFLKILEEESSFEQRKRLFWVLDYFSDTEIPVVPAGRLEEIRRNLNRKNK